MRIRWNHRFFSPSEGQADIAATRSAVVQQIEAVLPALRGSVRPEALTFLRTGVRGELQVNLHGFGVFGFVNR